MQIVVEHEGWLEMQVLALEYVKGILSSNLYMKKVKLCESMYNPL